MKILSYPKQGTELHLVGLEPVEELIEWVNSQLKDIHFENRYYPKFNWFKSVIPQAEKILNIGCGQGKETFALMWLFKAKKAVGLDKDEDTQRQNIFVAERLAATIKDFSKEFETQVIPDVSRMYPSEYAERLRAWYNDLPTEIRNGTVPIFRKHDVSRIELQSSNFYDLIYSRYVLDKILLDEGERGLHFAIQNMVNVLKPETGRIVFVVPSKIGIDGKQVSYNFENFVPKVLTLLKVEKDEEQLGDSEWPGTEPVGYIYGKQVL